MSTEALLLTGHLFHIFPRCFPPSSANWPGSLPPWSRTWVLCAEHSGLIETERILPSKWIKMIQIKQTWINSEQIYKTQAVCFVSFSEEAIANAGGLKCWHPHRHVIIHLLGQNWDPCCAKASLYRLTAFSILWLRQCKVSQQISPCTGESGVHRAKGMSSKVLPGRWGDMKEQTWLKRSSSWELPNFAWGWRTS